MERHINIDDYIVAMATTIQISNKLLEELRNRKVFDKESYEEVIWDLIEDTKELTEETKKDIEKARVDVRKGRLISMEEVEKSLGL